MADHKPDRRRPARPPDPSSARRRLLWAIVGVAVFTAFVLYFGLH